MRRFRRLQGGDLIGGLFLAAILSVAASVAATAFPGVWWMQPVNVTAIKMGGIVVILAVGAVMLLALLSGYRAAHGGRAADQAFDEFDDERQGPPTAPLPVVPGDDPQVTVVTKREE